MAEYFIELPWPPSTNTYWRNVRGRVLISKRGRQYRKDVKRYVMAHGKTPGFMGRVKLSVSCYPPDKRRRDLDNLLKSLQDSLTHAGVWGDDEQIDELHIMRRSIKKPGCVFVRVTEL